MSVLADECNRCDGLVRHQACQQHLNQHTPPHKLVPKTLPNSVQKIGFSKVIHLDDSTDQSDIAIRSILPDEMPQLEIEKRNVTIPQSIAQVGKVGSASRVQFMADHGSPANDKLDLNSNPVWTDVQRFDEDPLNIEKVVDLKPKKTMVPRKEIHKYQNTHNAARQTIDTGGCERKVQASPLGQSRNVMMAHSEPIYEIKEDEKSFFPLTTDPRVTATVSFSRKTGQANPYSAIQTKSIVDPSIKTGAKSSGKNVQYQENNYDDEPQRKIKVGNRNYPEGSQSEYSKQKQSLARGDRPYPLHHHECPDCHGFYCSTCKSTIPPSFRPFWDENEKPEIIQYYKSLQREAERRKEAQHHCNQCNPKEEQQHK